MSHFVNLTYVTMSCEETEDVDDLEKEALKEVAAKARELERQDLWPWAVSTGVVIQKEIS